MGQVHSYTWSFLKYFQYFGTRETNSRDFIEALLARALCMHGNL